MSTSDTEEMLTNFAGTVPFIHYEYIQNSKWTPVGIVQVPFQNPQESFALLITRLQEKLKPAQIIEITYLGQKIQERNNINIGNLFLDSSKSKKILLSVRTQTLQPLNQNQIEVTIKTAIGESFKVILQRDSKLDCLREKIYEIKNIHPLQHRLIYNDRQLGDNQHTLLDYNIENLSVIHLLFRLGGPPLFSCGPRFLDLKSNQLYSSQISIARDPNFHLVTPGTNIEAFCKNRNCKKYKKRVIFSIGFEQMFLMTEKNFTCCAYNHNFDFTCRTCHTCNHNLVPKKCGFFSCEWNFVGKKIGEEGIILGEYTTVGDEYYKQFSEIGKKAGWSELVVVSREKQTENRCTICQKYFVDEDNQWVSKCNHAFHFGCILKFTKILGCQVHCPVCYKMDLIE